MTYIIEEIIQTIKTARINKRLSQRALSAKAGIPQSHISKIENGGVNIKLSTLIDLARALDLEVTLVPRKLIPAVYSITGNNKTNLSHVAAALSVEKELKKIKNALNGIQTIPDAVKQVNELRTILHEIGNTRLPTKYLGQLREASEKIRAVREGPAALKEFRQTAKSLQEMRNKLVHNIPDIPTPAYSLDDDDA